MSVCSALVLLAVCACAHVETVGADSAAADVARTLSISFTFDDGAADHLTAVAPVLERYGFRGCFNVPTDWVGRPRKLSWADVRELLRRGHEVYPHGAAHTNLVTLLRAGETNAVVADIVRSREAFVRETGRAPRFFCPPYNACDAGVAARVRAAGMEPMTRLRQGFGGGTRPGTPSGCGFALDRARAQGKRHVDLMAHGGLPPSWGAFADEAELEAFVKDVADRSPSVRAVPYAEGHGKGVPDEPRHGALCLTFDDRNFASWTAALPLLEKHGAHVSFFVAGRIDDEALGNMRRLRAAGHTVGIHSLSHSNAPTNTDTVAMSAWADREIEPQMTCLRVADFPVFSLAYPNNRHTSELDAYLARRYGFTHFRAGAKVKYAFKGDVTPETVVRFDTVADAFWPSEWRYWKKSMNGIGIGSVYCYSRENVFRALRRAVERDEIVTFFSHSILPGNTEGVGMRTEWLEEILAEANRLGLPVLGFDDL